MWICTADVNRLSQLQEEADPNTDDKRGDENEEVEDDNKGYIDLLLYVLMLQPVNFFIVFTSLQSLSFSFWQDSDQ